MTSFYLIDAFTDKAFKGNPAAVVLLKSKDFTKHAELAREFNLSETAFIDIDSTCVSKESENNNTTSTFTNGSHFGLRWFTPTKEVKLCGHATLAAAYVLFCKLENLNNEIHFHTLSGILTVRRSLMDTSDCTLLKLSFPLNPYIVLDTSFSSLSKPLQSLINCFISSSSLQLKLTISHIKEVFYSKKTGKLFIRLIDGEESVQLLSLLTLPTSSILLNVDQTELEIDQKVTGISISVLASTKERDFVSRYTSPWNGIEEDPVNGSSHTTLAPYYAKELNRETVIGEMASKRGGKIICNILKEEEIVELCGSCVFIGEGKLLI
jgi:PhzF family phenazine biosynthesis protein